MNRVIFKYFLPFSPGKYAIGMDPDALILSVQNQAGNLVLWAEANAKEQTLGKLNFEIVYTGWAFIKSINHKYLATVTNKDGLIYHVYQIL